MLQKKNGCMKSVNFMHPSYFSFIYRAAACTCSSFSNASIACT